MPIELGELVPQKKGFNPHPALLPGDAIVVPPMLAQVRHQMGNSRDFGRSARDKSFRLKWRHLKTRCSADLPS